MDYRHKGFLRCIPSNNLSRNVCRVVERLAEKRGLRGAFFPFCPPLSSLSLSRARLVGLPPSPRPPLCLPVTTQQPRPVVKNFQVVPDVLNTRDNNVSFPLYNKQIHSLCELLMWSSIKLAFSPCAADDVGGMSLGA